MLARSWENGPVRPSSQDAPPHFRRRSLRIAPSPRPLELCCSVTQAFLFPNPGEWQVTVETEDERIIGKTTFLVEPDDRVFRRVETLVY